MKKQITVPCLPGTDGVFVRSTLLLAAVLLVLASAGHAQQVLDKSTVVIGTELDYPPYSFMGDDGRPTGFNVELTQAIAEVMGFDVEIRIRPWGEIRDALEAGRIDAIVGMYYSPERDKLVDFSSAFTIIHHAVFARSDSPKVTTEEDLRGKEIIVMRGDIMHDYVLEKDLTQNPFVVGTQAEALRLLASGKHDYALVAKLPGLYWVKKLKLSNVERVGPLMHPSGYCFAVSEGDMALAGRFSEGLAIIKHTNNYKQIQDKWLEPLEPHAITTDVVVRYAALILVPLCALIMITAVWSQVLRRQVAQRTAQLRQEIAEHQQAEEKLRKSEQEKALVLDNTNEIIAYHNIDHNVEWVNKAYLKTIGSSLPDIKGRKCYRAWGLDRVCTNCPVTKAIETGEHAEAELMPANQEHWPSDLGSWLIRAVPVKDVTGSIIGAIEVAYDITKRKKAEEESFNAQQRLIDQQRHETEHVEAELARVRQELVRSTRLAAIGQVSASIAHDLRNPLGSVRNAAYLLNRHLPKDQSKLLDYTDIINQEVAKADQIITNLLEMVRARPPRKRPVDLGQIIKEVEQARKSEGVACRISAAPDPFVVQADEAQLRQVIDNILSNSVYAMGGQGSFFVEASRDSDYDTIVLRDTGSGFAPEVRDRLFDALVTTKASGIGLGLTICRQIVEKHGGTIEADEHNQQGAVIRIRLPRG